MFHLMKHQTSITFMTKLLMEKESVQDLSGVELEYTFARAAQFDMIGSSHGPFATIASDMRSLFIFGGNVETVIHSSFSNNLSGLAMETAKKRGATLFVEDGVAKCRIKEHCAHGESFMEAMMRAVILEVSNRKVNEVV